MTVMEYQDVFDVSYRISEALEAAREGVPVSLVQNTRRYALVDVERLLTAFAAASPQARVVHDGGRWCLFVPGLPVLAEGPTVNDMLDDAVGVLREYADDWIDGLRERFDAVTVGESDEAAEASRLVGRARPRLPDFERHGRP